MAILEQYQSQLPELINSDSPREWIERQELVGPNAPEGEIGKIGDFPDPRLPGETQGKVRKFRLVNGREVYAKRVNSLRTRYSEEEIMISLEVDKSLKKVSPYFDTQEFIGIVYDRGAFYLLSLAITGERYSSEKEEEPDDFYRFKTEVRDILMPLGLGDIEHIFIYKDGKMRCVFLDFETHPYRAVKDANKATEALKSSSAVEREEKRSVSSSVNNPGGIDLRALPITTQFVLNQPLTANMPIAGSALNLNRALSDSRRVSLNNELRQIQDMLNAGIMPSSERIKEYALTSSSLKPEDYSREIDKILGCIADVFRLEEEKAKPTPQILKDMLILLESDKPAPLQIL